MPDGEVLATAEAAGFEVFLTADQSIAYRQNLRMRRISLVVLTSNNWPIVRAHASTIFAVACATDVAVVENVLPPKLGGPERL